MVNQPISTTSPSFRSLPKSVQQRYIASGEAVGQRTSTTARRDITGGTQIIVDVDTGRTATVRATPEKVKAINAARQEAINKRSSRKRATTSQEFQISLFRKQGYNVQKDKPTGAIIATKGDQKTIITRSGYISRVPKNTKINLVNLSTFKRKNAIQNVQKEVKKTNLSKEEKRKIIGIINRSGAEAGIAKLAVGNNYPKSLLTRLDRARRLPGQKATQLMERASTTGETLRGYERAGKKLTARERLGLVEAGAVSLSARAYRGFSILLTPDEIVKAIPKFGVDAVKSVTSLKPRGTIADIVDDFKRDPVGAFIEFWVAKKVITGALKVTGKVTSATIGKTKIAKSAASAASKTAIQLKNVAKKVPGVKQSAAVIRAASRLKKATKTRLFNTKLAKAITKTTSKIKTKAKTRALGKTAQKNLAREIIRKIENNKIKISNLKKLKQTPSIKKQVLRINSANKSLNVRLLSTKVKPGVRAIMRGGIKKELKPIKIKSPKTTKIKVKLYLSKETQLFLKKTIKLPTKRFITKVKQPLSKLGKKIIKLNPSKPIKILTKATKSKVVDYIIRPTARKLQLLGRRLKKFNLSIKKTVRTTLKKSKSSLRSKVRDIRISDLQKKVKKITFERNVKLRLRNINKNIKNYSLKIIKKTKIPKSTTATLNFIKRQSMKIERLLKKSGGRITNEVKKALNTIERKSPFKIKIQKIKLNQKRIKPRTSGRRNPNRKLSKIQLEKAQIRAILKGKKIMTSKTPTRIRKAVRRARALAERKRIAGIKQKTTKTYSRKLKIRDQQRLTSAQRTAIKRAKENTRKERDLIEQAARNRIKAEQYLDRLQRQKGDISKAITRAENIARQLKKDISKIKKSNLPKSTKQNAVNKLKNTETKVKNTNERIVQSGEQQLIQITKKANNKLADLKKKGKAAKTFKQKAAVNRKIAAAAGEAKNGIKLAKALGYGGKARNLASTVLALVALGKNIKEGKIKGRQNIRGNIPKRKIKPIIKPTQKQTPTTKRETIQKPDTIIKQIPEQGTRIDNKTVPDQIRIITNILAPLAASQAFRLRGKTISVKQTRLRGGLRRAVKFVYDNLKRKQRAFTPDIYSIIFGIRAKPKEKIQLLRKGRVFTGLERRSIV